jgi:hypothetical protein
VGSFPGELGTGSGIRGGVMLFGVICFFILMALGVMMLKGMERE